MTCDDVFDVLTRGPFPTGAAGDHLVERHLTDCCDCRRLATALQPAVELFQESVGPDESQGLPGYRGRAALPYLPAPKPHDVVLSDEATSFDLPNGQTRPWSRSDRAARGGPVPSSKAGRAFRRSHGKLLAPPVRGFTPARTNLMRFAAAVLIGVAAAAGSHGLGPWQAVPAGISDRPPRGNDSTIGLMGDDSVETTRQWLSRLALPAVCRIPHDRKDRGTDPFEGPLEGVQLAMALECCTNCHTKAQSGILSADARSVVVRACQACH
ncbi:MAG TPA: hypothetical protein VGG64_08440 [Pirellulales bacterium]|jgi:hypothetical protein